MYFENLQWLPWQREPNINQKQGKMVIFVIFLILKCNLPPINTPQSINMVIKIFLALFLINSCKFYMIKIVWGLKYSPLRMTIKSIHNMA